MLRVSADRLVPAAPAELAALLAHERPADGPVRRLCAAGDVGFSGRLAALAGGHDPFREIAWVVRGADLAFANLETPLVGEDPGGRLFAASTRAAALLAGAGFRLVNLANNHVLDYGPEGLASTLDALAAAGVGTLGAGDGARELVVTELDGLRVGWLGCARTLQPSSRFWEYDPAALTAAVRDASPRVDVLIVSVHMGYMYVDVPHPAQRRHVLELLGAGADLVLLHHPHVLQGVEVAPGGGVACYSLGNLLLDWREGEVAVDQMVEEQRTGGLFLIDLDRRGVCRLAVLPLRVDDGWVVRWARGDAGRMILDRLERTSDCVDVDALFHRQLAERATGLAFRTALGEIRRGRLKGVLALLRRLRRHHLRMVLGWLGARFKGRPGR